MVKRMNLSDFDKGQTLVERKLGPQNSSLWCVPDLQWLAPTKVIQGGKQPVNWKQ